MRFTESEWEIIDHRLQVPDAIADCCEDEHGADWLEVHDRVCEIQQKGHDALTNSDLDQMILADCAEGSTIFCDISDAVACGEMPKGKMMAMRKAARSLSDKLGVEVETA